MWIKHRNIEQTNKYMDVCPCIYGADEETMEQLMEKSITRDHIIEIEVKKLFEPLNGTDEKIIKEERRDELFDYLNKLPYDNTIWKSISKWWNINVKMDYSK